MVKLLINSNKFWNLYKRNNASMWFRGVTYSHTVNEIIDLLNTQNTSLIQSALNDIRGHFSFIFQNSTFSLAVVDRVRSSELNYFIDANNDLFITPDFNKILNLNFFNKSLNEKAIRQIIMSGYTIGSATLYENCKSLNAGQYLLYLNNKIIVKNYFNYFGDIKLKNFFDESLDELTQITINIFKRTLLEIGERQIVIPLSAGNDSRLVASIFKHLGAKNVLCYSYGQKNNFEAKVAKLISKKLGYKWVFIPLTYKSERKFYNSNEFRNFLKFSFSNSGISFFQSLSSISYLKKLNLIQDDAVFINGNSGDFISGGHIKHLNLNSDKNLKEIVCDSLIGKHYSLWGYLKTNFNINEIKKDLQVDCFNNSQDVDDYNAHLFYEKSEFSNRQSKYVISGQRVYEFYNYDWRLPLWDDEYLYFWRSIPKNFKENQLLYKKMLKLNNFGNVWDSDLPVNDKKINPVWIKPIRYFFKAIFFIFSNKNKWKQFHISFFYYWIDPILLSCYSSYFTWIKDFKKRPRSPISWIAKDYISLNNLNKKL